ncbi:hypothetical protein V1527DRAFT_196354 [Lipomyces starkeyi]
MYATIAISVTLLVYLLLQLNDVVLSCRTLCRCEIEGIETLRRWLPLRCHMRHTCATASPWTISHFGIGKQTEDQLNSGCPQPRDASENTWLSHSGHTLQVSYMHACIH